MVYHSKYCEKSVDLIFFEIIASPQMDYMKSDLLKDSEVLNFAKDTSKILKEKLCTLEALRPSSEFDLDQFLKDCTAADAPTAQHASVSEKNS